METNLLDRMLDTYLEEQTHVTMTLQNKIRVSGKIKAFDSYVIVMENHKQDIVYRHAISSLTPHLLETRKRQPPITRPAAVTTPLKSVKTASHKSRPMQPQALSASSDDQNINSSMKEGLLRWMQEQKAAK